MVRFCDPRQHTGCQGEAVITHSSASCGAEILFNPQINTQDLDHWMSGSTRLLVGIPSASGVYTEQV